MPLRSAAARDDPARVTDQNVEQPDVDTQQAPKADKVAAARESVDAAPPEEPKEGQEETGVREPVDGSHPQVRVKDWVNLVDARKTALGTLNTRESALRQLLKSQDPSNLHNVVSALELLNSAFAKFQAADARVIGNGRQQPCRLHPA